MVPATLPGWLPGGFGPFLGPSSGGVIQGEYSTLQWFVACPIPRDVHKNRG
nr:MAG TPA: hypothetical protein [Caudoviricetes sp.]